FRRVLFRSQRIGDHDPLFAIRYPLSATSLPWYTGTMVTIERSQTGIRIEKRILKVLKGLAEFHDLSVGDLLEGVLLHVFEGKTPFGERSLRKVAELRKVYELDLNAAHSHKLVEEAPPKTARKG